MANIIDPLDDWVAYEQMFGEKPPVFGYEDGEAISAINKAIKTKTPMTPINKIIEKELGSEENTIIT